MAHTALSTTRQANSREGFMKTLPQISLADADVTTALAAGTRSQWVLVTNSDGSLRHVVPVAELSVTP